MAQAEQTQVVLTDARAIRAIAHEVRQQVITILYTEQRALTATQLAGRAAVSPSVLSYHLRALERWGVVIREEVVDGDGRNRPWRAAGTMLNIKAGRGVGDTAAADVLFESMVDDQRARIRHLRTLPADIRDHYTSMSVSTFWLTDQEAIELRGTLDQLLRDYRRRGSAPADETRRRVSVNYSVLPSPDPGDQSAHP